MPALHAHLVVAHSFQHRRLDTELFQELEEGLGRQDFHSFATSLEQEGQSRWGSVGYDLRSIPRRLTRGGGRLAILWRIFACWLRKLKVGAAEIDRNISKQCDFHKYLHIYAVE